MDEQIHRYLQGIATEAERARLEAWRQDSDDHERAFRAAAEVWRLTQEPIAARSAGTAAPSADALIRAAARTPVEVPRAPGRPIALVAAAAVVLLVAGWGFSRLADPWRAAEVHVAADAPVTVALADGSYARLAPSARLEYRDAPDRRDVRLTGRAFFAVRGDPNRPFTVSSRQAETEVLGTRFDVEERGDTVRVAVVEGMVALSSPAGSVRMGRGHVGVAAPGVRPTIDTLGARTVFDLVDPPLFYQESPLGQVVNELVLHFGLRTAAIDTSVIARPVTVRFENETAAEAFDAVCVIAQVRCRIEDSAASIAP